MSRGKWHTALAPSWQLAGQHWPTSELWRPRAAPRRSTGFGGIGRWVVFPAGLLPRGAAPLRVFPYNPAAAQRPRLDKPLPQLPRNRRPKRRWWRKVIVAQESEYP